MKTQLASTPARIRNLLLVFAVCGPPLHTLSAGEPQELPVEFLLREPNLAAEFPTPQALTAAEQETAAELAELLSGRDSSPKLGLELPWKMVPLRPGSDPRWRIRIVLRSERDRRDTWFLDAFVVTRSAASGEQETPILLEETLVRTTGTPSPPATELPSAVVRWFVKWYVGKRPTDRGLLLREAIKAESVPIGQGAPLAADTACHAGQLLGELRLDFESFGHLRRSTFLMRCKALQRDGTTADAILISKGARKCGQHIGLSHTDWNGRAVPPDATRDSMSSLTEGPVHLLKWDPLPSFLN